MAVVPYSHRSVEKKCFRYWAKTPVNRGMDARVRFCLCDAVDSLKEGFSLSELRANIVADVWCRYQILNGYRVIHPVLISDKEESTADRSDHLKNEIFRMCSFYSENPVIDVQQNQKEIRQVFQKLFDEKLICKDETDGSYQMDAGRYLEEMKQSLSSFAYPEMVKKMQEEWLTKRMEPDTKLRSIFKISEKKEDGIKIPLLHCRNCGIVSEDEEEQKFLSSQSDRCPICKMSADRVDGVISDWFCQAVSILLFQEKNKELQSPVLFRGIEYTVVRLLQLRFLSRVLYEKSIISFQEPFRTLYPIGNLFEEKDSYLLNRQNKDSKASAVENYGIDCLRVYLLFLSAPQQDVLFRDEELDGAYRFLNRYWTFVLSHLEDQGKKTDRQMLLEWKMAEEITDELEQLQFNTVISSLMKYLNEMRRIAKTEKISAEALHTMIILLAPVAPHMAEELFRRFCKDTGKESSVFAEAWPKAGQMTGGISFPDEEVLEIPVQINGKRKTIIKIHKGLTKDDQLALAKKAVEDRIYGKIIREVCVPGKIINFVIQEEL